MLLGKIKIHEIAKEAGLTSKQIIEKAKSLGIDVSSHLSSVDEKQAKAIRNSLGLNSEKAEEKANTNKSKTEKNKKNRFLTTCFLMFLALIKFLKIYNLPNLFCNK